MCSKVEQKWVNYWSDLYALIDRLESPKILNVNYQLITVEEAQALIQDAVYGGNSVEFKIDFFLGEKAIIITLTERKT
jgi:hypothetical protein